MRTILGLSILLLSLPLFALELDGLFINQVIPRLNEVVAASSNIRCEESEEQEAETIQKCAVELCGPANKNKSGLLTNINYKEYVDGGTVRDFGQYEDRLKKVLAQRIEVEKKQNELFEGIRQTDGSYEIKLDQYSEAEQAGLVHVLFDAKIAVNFNFLADGKLAYQIEDKNPDLYKELNGSPALEDYKENVKRFIENKIKNQNDVAIDEKFVKNLESDLKMKPFGGKSENLFCYSDLCKKGVQEFYSHKLDKKMGERQVALAKIDQDKVLSSCRLEYYSKDQDRKSNLIMKKQVPSIIKRFKKEIISKFSTESQKSMIKFFNELEVNFGADISLENRDEKFIKDFNKNLTLAQEQIETPLDEDLNITSYAIRHLRKDDDNGPYYPLRGLPCGHVAASSVISDSVTPGDLSITENAETETKKKFSLFNNIKKSVENLNAKEKTTLNISNLSCNHPKIGKQIIAHELGHVLQLFFIGNEKTKHISSESLEQFEKTSLCAIDGYKKIEWEDGAADHRRMEDQADIFSNMIHKDDKNLSNCIGLHTDENQSSYKDLSFMNPSKKDTHSSHFLRLIRQALSKKKPLPTSCQSLVDKYQDQYNFQVCTF